MSSADDIDWLDLKLSDPLRHQQLLSLVQEAMSPLCKTDHVVRVSPDVAQEYFMTHCIRYCNRVRPPKITSEDIRAFLKDAPQEEDAMMAMLKDLMK